MLLSERTLQRRVGGVEADGGRDEAGAGTGVGAGGDADPADLADPGGAVTGAGGQRGQDPEVSTKSPGRSGDGPESAQAKDWLARVREVRVAVRQARPGYWFPLLVFGLIVLVSTPLYVQNPIPGSHDRSMPAFFPTGFLSDSPTRAAVFWVVALPVGFLLVTLYYGMRARRHGVEVSLNAFLLVGLAVFGLLVLASLAGATFFLGDLAIRGLLPLFVIAFALLVLAFAQRSIGQVGFALAFVALCLVANLYDMENVVNRMLGSGYGPSANVVITSVALLLGAIGFGTTALIGLIGPIAKAGRRR
jgi:hypothetical protein